MSKPTCKDLTKHIVEHELIGTSATVDLDTVKQCIIDFFESTAVLNCNGGIIFDCNGSMVIRDQIKVEDSMDEQIMNCNNAKAIRSTK